MQRHLFNRIFVIKRAEIFFSDKHTGIYLNCSLYTPEVFQYLSTIDNFIIQLPKIKILSILVQAESSPINILQHLQHYKWALGPNFLRFAKILTVAIKFSDWLLENLTQSRYQYTTSYDNILRAVLCHGLAQPNGKLEISVFLKTACWR